MGDVFRMIRVLNFTLLLFGLAGGSAHGGQSRCEMGPEKVAKLKEAWTCQWNSNLFSCYDQTHPEGPHSTHGTGEHGHGLGKTALHLGHGAHVVKEIGGVAKETRHVFNATKTVAAARNVIASSEVAGGTEAAVAGAVAAGVTVAEIGGPAKAMALRVAAITLGVGAVTVGVTTAALIGVEKTAEYQYELYHKACISSGYEHGALHAKQDPGRNCRPVYDDEDIIKKFMNLPADEQQKIMRDETNVDGQFTCIYYRNLLDMLTYKPDLSNLVCGPKEFSIDAAFPDGTVMRHKVNYAFSSKEAEIVSIENSFEKAGKIFAKRFASKVYVDGEQFRGLEEGQRIPEHDPGYNHPSTVWTAIMRKRYIPDARECCLISDDIKRKACRDGLLKKEARPPGPKKQGADASI